MPYDERTAGVWQRWPTLERCVCGWGASRLLAGHLQHMMRLHAHSPPPPFLPLHSIPADWVFKHRALQPA
eukprot:53648-Chlamydomonas_euryale.AAC.1